MHEEALSCELAGYFFANNGGKKRSYEMFQRAYDAYMKWGAVKKAATIPLAGSVHKTQKNSIVPTKREFY